MKTLLPILLILIHGNLFAQLTTQTVRGTILDKDSEIPLIGANVVISSGEVEISTITDTDGKFKIEGVLVGRQTLVASYLGYSSITFPNIVVTSGKEVILNLSLEESITQLDEIVIKSETSKDKSINEMAAISARTFSLEEVTRYSGGRNDVSRLVTNYAGVGTSDDSRNDIVIRGNSPTGVLWRLEGVPIPNPNHFSTLGTTGGPVSALNTNLLKNSDFLTSAFPAEYGNAISGVFDVGFRSGNKEKYEFTTQLGAFSGLEAMAEGPLNASKTSSFLVSYRHSFVALANAAGLDIGTSATPNYRDLSFKIDIGKGKLGKLEVFGIGGTSDIDFLGNELDEEDIFAPRDADSYVESLFGVIGAKHTYLFNDKTYLRTTISTSRSESTFSQEVYLDESYTEKYDNTKVSDVQDRMVFSAFLNTKHNAALTTRAGMTIERLGISSFSRDRLNPDANGDGIPEMRQLRDVDGSFYVYQPFIQNKYKLSDRFIFNLGLHGQLMSKTQDAFLEPRLGINYNLTSKSKINFGYGLHSQNQPLPVFFLLTEKPDGSFVDANANLKFTKAHHFVLGYDYNLGDDWRAKVETYYQSLYDVPVEKGSSSFSILNTGADFVFPQVDDLVNSGSGRNYGLEITVEKFFSRGYYGLFTSSLFESKYTGSDGIERNSAFNNKYIFNLLGGKEWKMGNNNSFSVDFKITNSGGRYYTPIDLEASKIARTEIERDDLAFSNRYSPYFRFDVKFGFQINKSKFSQQFYIDFQNVTNRENVFQNRYDRADNTVKTFYQSGFFPDLLYRIQF